MTEYVQLLGAEDVHRAGNTISGAAERMQSASNTMADSVHQYQMILQEHQVFMTEWLDRFDKIFKRII